MKDGRIMSKAMVKRGQSPALKKWRKAVAQAKAKMGKDGFVLVKGKLLEEAARSTRKCKQYNNERTQGYIRLEKCVNSAKKTCIPKNTYVVLQGKLLREAQKCYCAMGY